MRSISEHSTDLSYISRLEVLDDGVGAGEFEVVLGGLESSVGNLAVVDDDGETLGTALLISPADALGEASLGVGKEELAEISKGKFQAQQHVR